MGSLCVSQMKLWFIPGLSIWVGLHHPENAELITNSTAITIHVPTVLSSCVITAGYEIQMSSPLWFKHQIELVPNNQLLQRVIYYAIIQYIMPTIISIKPNPIKVINKSGHVACCCVMWPFIAIRRLIGRLSYHRCHFVCVMTHTWTKNPSCFAATKLSPCEVLTEKVKPQRLTST